MQIRPTILWANIVSLLTRDGFERIVNEDLVGPRVRWYGTHIEAPSDNVGTSPRGARDNDKRRNGCVRMDPCPKGLASPFILGVLP